MVADRDDALSSDALKRVSRGDRGAVEELLGRYFPDLRDYLQRRASPRVRARESASDLAQSVCRELLEQVADGRLEFRGEERFRQWMYRAAILKVLNRHRYWLADQRLPEGEEPAFSDFGASPGGTPSEHAMAFEELERFERAFGRLPERYHEVISLAYIDRCSHKEIAKALDISEGNSRVLLARALSALARLGVEF